MSVKLTYQGKTVDCLPDETVLEALERAELSVPSSCRAGVCQNCMLKAVEGDIPADGQSGLSDSQKSAGLFLSCQTKPKTDLSCVARDHLHFIESAIENIEQLSEDIYRLTVACEKEFDGKPGQYVNIQRPDGLVRSYSIANSDKGRHLEFHIRALSEGEMSGWVSSEAHEGDTLFLSSALGDCVYHPEQKDSKMVLIGTGTGVAPLQAIVHEAIDNQHIGEIHLFHGVRESTELYLHEELSTIAEETPHFTYYPCVSGGDRLEDGYLAGRANELALSTFEDWNNALVYLCGNPDMVKTMKKKLYLQGVDLDHIFADPFYVASSSK